MPVVWASRLQGTPLPDRVPGSDLIWSISAQASVVGATVYLLGGAPGAGLRAAERLTTNFPAITIAGTQCPSFGFLDREDDVTAMVRDVVRTDPDIVFVGLPSPSAETVIDRLRPALPKTWFLGYE